MNIIGWRGWLPDFRVLFYSLFSNNIRMCSGGQNAPGSDSPHKITRYWFYYSTVLSHSFPPDQNGQAEMFCTSYVPTPKGQIAGPALKFFYMIHRGGRMSMTHWVRDMPMHIEFVIFIWLMKFVAFIYYRFLLWSRPDLEKLLCVILMRYTHTHIHTHTATHCNTLPHAQTHTATHMQTHMQTQSCCV